MRTLGFFFAQERLSGVERRNAFMLLHIVVYAGCLSRARVCPARASLAPVFSLLELQHAAGAVVGAGCAGALPTELQPRALGHGAVM
jgi:hypothetical protein